MKSHLTRVVVLIGFSLSITSLSTAIAAESKNKAHEKEAMAIVQEFAGTLKPQLKAALKSGGPAHAVNVCSVIAPTIATGLSAKTGWQVKRVSLKARNNKSALPDAWEKEILQQFDQRQQNGKSVKTMSHSETVGGEFRFMKAQGIEPVCLKCHGPVVDPSVEAALNAKYPFDLARGYQLGQVRGAFSLVKDLEQMQESK